MLVAFEGEDGHGGNDRGVEAGLGGLFGGAGVGHRETEAVDGGAATSGLAAEDVAGVDVEGEDEEDDGGEGDYGDEHDLAVQVVTVLVVYEVIKKGWSIVVLAVVVVYAY